MPRKRDPRPCVHCQKVSVPKGRGLCRACHETPAVLKQHKLRASGKFRPPACRDTKKAVDALVERQYRNLPEWWITEKIKMTFAESLGLPPPE